MYYNYNSNYNRTILVISYSIYNLKLKVNFKHTQILYSMSKFPLRLRDGVQQDECGVAAFD